MHFDTITETLFIVDKSNAIISLVNFRRNFTNS